ncbi:MAG: hypothetical protein KA715_01905 [Xanthomonadaceae bacterium]|nr:hypothetical protein [Xanthomonadaceae bacterium]
MKVGPIDPRLPGVFSVELDLEGDWIKSAKTNFGFTVKGIEQTLLNKPRKIAPFFSGKMDSEAAFFYELALSRGIESVSNFEPNVRTQTARLIFCELSRVSAHLKTIALISKEVEINPAFHYLMREREKILDLFELATGSRHSLNICRPGGFSDEISEGFIERVRDLSRDIKSHLLETHALLSENLSFKKRTQGKGVVSKETILKKDLDGVLARSVGISRDLRISDEIYIKNGWNPSVCPDAISNKRSDIYSRFFVWMAEIEESILFLEKVCFSIPLDQPVTQEIKKNVSGQKSVQIETQRGELTLDVSVPEEMEFGYETSWKTPSKKIIQCVNEALFGARTEDVYLILLSLNFSVSEVDA